MSVVKTSVTHLPAARVPLPFLPHFDVICDLLLNRSMATQVHVGFRAEKRSAQASAHPLSQAQGGLFCVLTTVCLFVTERVLTKTE